MKKVLALSLVIRRPAEGVPAGGRGRHLPLTFIFVGHFDRKNRGVAGRPLRQSCVTPGLPPAPAT